MSFLACFVMLLNGSISYIVHEFEIQCNVVNYLFAADDVVVVVNDAEEEELLTRPGSRWSAASSGSTSC
jgi:hypothetical protein